MIVHFLAEVSGTASGTADAIRDWASAIVPSINLLLILVAAVKVMNRTERGLTVFEDRLLKVEKITEAHVVVVEAVAAQSVRVEALTQEMERVRDRLDRFLDSQSIPREGGRTYQGAHKFAQT